MDQISQKLLYQRLRNRVIELLELYCSSDHLAEVGAFEAIDLVDDWLPLDYDKALNVFTEHEKRAISEFLKLYEIASDATTDDMWDARWFKSSDEWMRLSIAAREALNVLLARGHSSENVEDHSLPWQWAQS